MGACALQPADSITLASHPLNNDHKPSYMRTAAPLTNGSPDRINESDMATDVPKPVAAGWPGTGSPGRSVSRGTMVSASLSNVQPKIAP